MKIKKLKGDWRVPAEGACQMIAALKDAREVSMHVRGSEDFQGRCNDAIIALANRLMEEHVERFYEPDTKMLGHMVRDGKFDDPSNFKTQFDGVDTAGTEAKERYA